MRYILLIYADETMWNTMSEADQHAGLQEYEEVLRLARREGLDTRGRPARRHRTRRPRSARPTARSWRPTGRSRRRRNSSAATTSSSARTWTRRSRPPGSCPPSSTGRSRSGRSSTCDRDIGRRRPPVPPRVRASGRDAHPRARRLRAGGGGGAGGVRDRARTLARGRRPRQPRVRGSRPRRAIGRSTASAGNSGVARRRTTSNGSTTSRHSTTCMRSRTTGCD